MTEALSSNLDQCSAGVLLTIQNGRFIRANQWGKLNSPHDILHTTLLGKIQDGGFIRAFLGYIVMLRARMFRARNITI